MATKEKFVDFSVNPHWIWNLVQSRKMSTRSARDELVASANRLKAHLSSIVKLIMELAAVGLREKIARKEELFAKQRQRASDQWSCGWRTWSFRGRGASFLCSMARAEQGRRSSSCRSSAVSRLSR